MKKNIRYISTLYEMISDKCFSLLRFNIGFKLTLEFTITLISFIILINMLFYIGAKTWLYLDIIDQMKRGKSVFELNMNNDCCDKIFEFEEMEYFLYQESNKKLISTNSNQQIKYEQHPQRIEILTFIQRHKPQWYYYESIVSKKNQGNLILVMRMNATGVHKRVDFLWGVIIGISILLILLVWISLSRISKKHLKPIKIMTNKVQEISVSDLSARLDIRGTKDELKDLAATFNDMMDEIENSYEKQKQFVSDASHELRTPIAVIKGYASMVNRWGKEDSSVLEESLKAIEDESRRMQSLVEGLLFLARRDKGTLEMKKERFQIQGLLMDIVKETDLIDNNHNIEGNYEYDGDVYASLDQLKQALRIFVDNSIKYTQEDGLIKIGLRASEKDVYITIEDNGIGISQEDLPYIFDRFYRADQARTRENKGGSGLGLSIAKVIIEQHQGSINVNSKLGEGTQITVILPKNLEESQD